MKKSLGARPPPVHALSMSLPGNVRIGPVLAIPALLSESGVSPQTAFAQAGIDPRLFDDPDDRTPLEALGRLFDTCVTLTGCDHFGLLVGERFELKSFGPLGHLLRNSPTVGAALRNLLLHLHLHDRGAAPLLLTPDPACVIFGYSVYRHGMPAVAHILDAAIAIGYGILKELCGPTWKPLRVQFSHSRPGSTAPYSRVFGSDVSFEAEVSGIVLASSWLGRSIEGADETLHDLFAKAIRDAEDNGPMSFADQVQGLLPQMILSGTASAEAVARLFAIHERTLRRRLEKERKNLQQLINEARFELAQQLLQNTCLSVSAIATALRYDDANAFSRAFRNWANLSPSQWRARQ